MKIERLIGILSILLQRDKVTAPYLAEKFEVSRRTINRDIEDLSRAGIPIVTTQGVGGGISIMEGYRIDRTLLTSADMQAVLAGLHSLDSVSGTKRYRQLMDKLSAEEDDLINVDRHIIIDLSNWDKSVVADKIELIRSAIEDSQKIAFHYFSPTGEDDRVIEPYHLVFQWSSWYVWGYCMKREAYRMFKLTRMTGLRNTGEHSAKREVPAYTCDKLRHMKGEVRATIKFDRSIKWRVLDEFGADFLEYDENGNIIVTFTWSDVQSFYQFILSFGDKAEILSPKSYRDGFSETLKNIQKKYER